MGASSFGSTVGGIVMFGVASICFCFLAVSSALDFSMSFRTCSSNELGTELGRQQLQQEFGATTPKVALEKSQGDDLSATHMYYTRSIAQKKVLRLGK